MEWILIGTGGIFGALVRFILGRSIAQKTGIAFPIGTFIINITGAVLLGCLTGMHLDKNYYLLLGEGFLGAYTTFSTFMYEGFDLFRQNKKLNAAVYIIGSLFIGIIGFIGGFEIVNNLRFG